jgi:hypothetical protein
MNRDLQQQQPDTLVSRRLKTQLIVSLANPTTDEASREKGVASLWCPAGGEAIAERDQLSLS